MMRKWKKSLQKLRRNEDGAVSVELALVSTLLLTLAIPTVDYGLAFFHNVKVKNAIRDPDLVFMVRTPITKPASVTDCLPLSCPTSTSTRRQVVN